LIVFADPEVLLLDNNNEKYKKQIADGLKNGEFRPYLQFVVDARTEEIKCAELLSRWEHPEKGILRISEYLDLVIQIGLIEEYDLYIFRRTCDLLEEIHRSGNEEFRVSCNITQMTLSDEKFTEKIESVLKGYSFKRNNLVIEVTEDSLVEKQTVAVKNIEKCKELGLGIAIDDMGTGYASFELLSILPVDAIKIAREIVVSAKTDKGNRLLSGIIALASSMELWTVCEGVEDELTAELVKKAGCDYIQGFYYANVLPLSEAKRILRI
jgi:EAL domain-containing protein (putative c-di-GMP-specific phosphodiesterase class I)